ncbi:MAG TPA: hypothetical protein HA282_06000 [Nanoarchaeota archaeon]|nr:MAG: hypothetical protein QT01_C0001G0037 [archaeon GW2011_AR6]HIH17665.1 hypothetical protein [Nanoarchaeota archaeon]HIH34405.1 hypothetical protein [Nanoarchaeota archaeon]HIH51700.1 hypothetical protein [Nanoarchaeota archaeon]HIH66729.1 hypothetical protein [Nanoarchaeota archaeon]
MAKREKRLKKQAESLLRRAMRHRIKAETLQGRKETTLGYWLKEADAYERQAKERLKLIKRKKRSAVEKAAG